MGLFAADPNRGANLSDRIKSARSGKDVKGSFSQDQWLKVWVSAGKAQQAVDSHADGRRRGPNDDLGKDHGENLGKLSIGKFLHRH